MNPQLPVPPFVLIVLYIWSLAAKGFALWRAANLGQRNWFIAILVLNTIGIVELIYLFKFASWRKRFKIMAEWTVNLFYPRDISML